MYMDIPAKVEISNANMNFALVLIMVALIQPGYCFATKLKQS